jgi:hypothetical protein
MSQSVEHKFSRVQSNLFDCVCVRFVNCVVHNIADLRTRSRKEPTVFGFSRGIPTRLNDITNAGRHRHSQSSGYGLCARNNENGSLRIDEADTFNVKTLMRVN